MRQTFCYFVLIVFAASFVCAFGFPQALCSLISRSQPKATDVKKGDGCTAADKAHMLAVEHCGVGVGAGEGITKPAVAENWIEFKIAIVADLDEEKSKVPDKKNTWRSFYREGLLRRGFDGKYSVTWDEKTSTLQSLIAEKGRGLELSELAKFKGRLYTVDDRTGIVYQILKGKVIPWVILTDGDGSVAKGFKGEWMTVKDNTLYVGGLGKAWTTPTGEVVSFNPQFVKSIGPLGDVVHHNWRNVYLAVMSALGIKDPGYVIHEAVIWSSHKKRWYFLPRRASKEKYDDKADERRATNFLISCNEKFEDFTVVTVGILKPTHGFSSLKFVPGTNDDIIVALRTVEDAGQISTYIMVFDVNGTIIMDEQLVGNDKFEGVEFI
eukprot:gene9143-10116_t